MCLLSNRSGTRSTKYSGVYFYGHLPVVVSGLLVWYLTPQIYSKIAAQLAKLFNPTTVLYVKPEGTSLTCNSWENACGLQTALALARAGDEIWVQAGNYKPAADTRFPEATFQLKGGVALYGGFAGRETALDQRNWGTYLTVLSGDLGGDVGERHLRGQLVR